MHSQLLQHLLFIDFGLAADANDTSFPGFVDR